MGGNSGQMYKVQKKSVGGRMFPFITATWNPLGGACKHGCEYCWARELADRYMHKKYTGLPRLVEKEFRHKFIEEDFVFVCDMCDLFGDWVPEKLILEVINYVNHSPARFLFLTKNPKRYREMLICFEDNAVLGATIETDYDKLALCNAPSRLERLTEMKGLNFPHKMVSVEPIMKFTPKFAEELAEIKPDFVAVGYDNYNHRLLEPSLTQTMILIGDLREKGITVYEKTLRERVEVLP